MQDLAEDVCVLYLADELQGGVVLVSSSESSHANGCKWLQVEAAAP